MTPDELRERVADIIRESKAPTFERIADAVIAVVLEEAAREVETEGMYYAGLREGAILDRVATAIRALKGGADDKS